MGQTDTPGPEARENGGGFSAFLRRLSQVLRGRHADSIRESLEEVIEESERRNPELARRERVMLANLLKFGELRVDDVKVPRADIVAVEESISICELIAKFREAQHSRLPIYRDSLDDPIGLVHIKDVVGLGELGPDGIMRWPDVPISRVKRDILVAPPSMPASDLLVKMQTSQIHLALVIDEYGGTDGLVSIEDLVEEIVGEIRDEHEKAEVVKESETSYIFNGNTDIDLLEKLLGVRPDEKEATTIAGLVSELAGHIPKAGEIFEENGLRFEVLESTERRVDRVRVTLQPRQVGA
jgi:CBS domain containing-hemolysin-like protein